jgi:beta-N-acetylhexosaminidase
MLRRVRTAAVMLAAIALAGCAAKEDGGEPEAPAEDPIELGTEPIPEPTTPQREEPPGPERPEIVDRPIPFPAKRKEEMTAYAQRHYDIDTYRLEDPEVIVEHVTATEDFDSAFNTFAADVPDPELGELPGTCSHFIVDTDGTIYQLVPLNIMCRHTVGLNYTSFGIEHVGLSDADLLGNRRQLQASLELTNWLRCKHGIEFEDVIGHNENTGSPHHEENVPELRTQTHGDMTAESMGTYRAKLRRLSC